jgi:hypothetical protein
VPYDELAFQDLIGVYLVVDILVPIESFDGEGAELASKSSNKLSSHNLPNMPGPRPTAAWRCAQQHFRSSRT